MKITPVRVILFFLGASDAAIRGKVQRHLSTEEKIAGYEPSSQVTDHAAIDLDQKSIERQITLQTESSFDTAMQIYQHGGHSKSYALLTLLSDLPNNLSKGTVITGTDTLGNQVTGKAYADFTGVSSIISVQYSTFDTQVSHVGCQVGALPDDEIITDGCFRAAGNITIDGSSTLYGYTYNIDTDNRNDRTIAKFSTSAVDKMLQGCPGCPYKEFKKYYDYYGKADYADTWIKAAADGTTTDYKKGNADFGSYSLTGRGEAFKKGTAYMSVYMYVLREFEDALDDCSLGCINCNDDPVHAWDEGVAFYTGSVEGQDASANGYLIHQLADKRCADFKTCGSSGTNLEGISKINYDLFSLFAIGQNDLLMGRCDALRPTIDKIADLMSVPLVQGTLRYAYKVDKMQGGEKEKAEGAVFAAAVLPRVAKCNAKDADTIYTSMGVGTTNTDQKAVKKAFENNYSCMGIKCADVGGLWSSADENYYVGAETCKDSTNSSVNTDVILGVSLGAIIGALLLGVAYLIRREKKGVPVFMDSQPKEMS